MRTSERTNAGEKFLAATLMFCLLAASAGGCSTWRSSSADREEDEEEEMKVPTVEVDMRFDSSIDFRDFPQRVFTRFLDVKLEWDAEDKESQPNSLALMITEQGALPDWSKTRFGMVRHHVRLDLGRSGGSKDVWFGFKGGGKPDATWTNVTLIYDQTTPPMVVFAPTNRVVSARDVQVHGYSKERLKSLYYRHFNEDGGLAARDEVNLYTGGRWSGFEPKDLEDNQFSFGLELLKGTNTVELSGTNRLGQAVSTNFVLLLDWSHDTNPPHLQLRYPASGMSMPESRFLADGRVDDPSADISAVVVSGELTTNRFGSVQPHGDEGPKFFINDVPLLGETNLLTITAMDLAGNETSTSIVVQADVVVAYHALKLDHSRRIIERIGGWVRPGHRVLVNEQEATVEGTNWSAVTIPMRSGDPEMFVVKAVPVRPNPAATQR